MVQKRWRICLLYIVDGEGNMELGESDEEEIIAHVTNNYEDIF